MTQEQFIEAIRTEVHNSAVDGMKSTLENPPGRRPAASIKDLSNWYRSLSSDDKERALSLVRHSVHSAIFGFLCVLDGVRSIETGSKNSGLELFHVSGTDRKVISPVENEALHDIYQSMVYEEVFGEKS